MRIIEDNQVPEALLEVIIDFLRERHRVGKLGIELGAEDRELRVFGYEVPDAWYQRLVAAVESPAAAAEATRAVRERAVAGALRATINDHGPITPDRIGSAVKRVLGNLANVGTKEGQ
jgi:hypothetical protein